MDATTGFGHGGDGRPVSVVLDGTPLGLGHVNPGARTGIFRVCERITAAALDRPELDATIASLGGRDQAVVTELFCRSRGEPWSRRHRRTWRSPMAPHGLVLAARVRAGRSRAWDLARRIAYRTLVRRPLPPCDIVHSFYDPLPDAGVAPARTRVLTVHDLAPMRMPSVFQPATIAHFSAILASIDIEHDHVVCVSESTRRDLLALSPVRPEHVVTIPLAADERFAPPPADAVRALRARLSLGDAPYIACLSALGPRKNLSSLLRCVAAAVAGGRLGDLRVVVAGPEAAGAADISAAAAADGLRGRVVFTGFLPDEDLPALLGGAVLLAYPSLYEGFGLPALEAMACGTPVVCGDNSSLPEVVGDGGLLVDAADARALTEAIVAVAGDAALRARLAERALRGAARFSWRRTVDAHVALYRSLAEGVRPPGEGRRRRGH